MATLGSPTRVLIAGAEIRGLGVPVTQVIGGQRAATPCLRLE